MAKSSHIQCVHLVFCKVNVLQQRFVGHRRADECVNQNNVGFAVSELSISDLLILLWQFDFVNVLERVVVGRLGEIGNDLPDLLWSIVLQSMRSFLKCNELALVSSDFFSNLSGCANIAWNILSSMKYQNIGLNVFGAVTPFGCYVVVAETVPTVGLASLKTRIFDHLLKNFCLWCTN